jgi:phosphoglycerate dehydrogenase-like enzyme
MTVGVWGTGRIGRRTAEKFAALGVRVLAHNRDGSAGGAPGIEWVPLETLLASSDVVSLHIPAVAGAPPVVDADLLARMRPGSFLVNTSRGALVDTQALARSVAEGHLAGAALDVVDGEPRIPAELVPLDRICSPARGVQLQTSPWPSCTRACGTSCASCPAGPPAPRGPCDAPLTHHRGDPGVSGGPRTRGRPP